MRGARSLLFMGGWIVAAALCFSGPSRAADEPATLSAADAAEAKQLRDKGGAFFQKKDYPNAVDLLQRSLKLERKFGAMASLASALNELKRFDEALVYYEAALTEFPKARADKRKLATEERDTLLSKVGTIAVEGDLVPGARLFIDSREVGLLPLPSPVRVLGGMHEVRQEIPGFAPIVTSVEVTAGKPSVAKLVAKERLGKLEIQEKHNWVLQVEIDGQNVGVTPLKKLVTPGEHRIRLRGYMRPEALLLCETPVDPVEMGARMESAEKVVTLGLFETQAVELSAEDMDASLRIESTPAMAGLWIDGHDVGKTPWEGRLPLGEHAIEVRSKGFYIAKQSVTLERRKQKDIAVVLEREPDLAARERAARNAKIGVGVAYGLGGVGLGMFAVAGGMTVQNVNQLQTNCPNQQCPSTEEGRLQSIDNLSTLATVGVVIAGVGAVAGTTLFFLTKPEERKKTGAPRVGVSVGLGHLGIEGSF